MGGGKIGYLIMYHSSMVKFAAKVQNKNDMCKKKAKNPLKICIHAKFVVSLQPN